MAFACHAQVDGIDNLEPPNQNPVQYRDRQIAFRIDCGDAAGTGAGGR